MTFEEMAAAISEARRTFNVADRMADTIADLLVGRLRKVGSNYALKRLKDELREFNAHTGRWRDE